VLEFEWDEEKATTNLKKHGVSFDEARTAFGDPLSLTIPDTEHSEGEFRYLLLGMSNSKRLLVISHTYREQRIRIINARIATSKERNDYESTD
jgi:uncharacterized DUF497 family protein